MLQTFVLLVMMDGVALIVLFQDVRCLTAPMVVLQKIHALHAISAGLETAQYQTVQSLIVLEVVHHQIFVQLVIVDGMEILVLPPDAQCQIALQDVLNQILVPLVMMDGVEIHAQYLDAL